ncbi:potassium-transporting ATPase subunit KdpC [Clostridium tertium]|jgi:K+-transporting ATPase ATPase C chain|uniref:Potassium-transporting ATPase KdpC subunit n=1 Tax=Clostridium tertium TaxID=1559 RepID=A0A9X3XMR4_9CLOT|nr:MULTISPECIES: potassium-transporting ATPase subunit KdpC [Clostridium]MBS5308657.1 potassium-transporting ATPase subunit KdpC [Clostridium sp.]MBU6134126.1 potassium-transporting ATPase subunit KdpC [Clostridium tertium]MDB1921031.1 potassium-transporting ATPase subunit KdpC [Clostridium tertium]MDB1925561.1 potassium-transporting ATPase subunit KdpC [Clostridium tertium]MDB1928644.1 potassium-transporting ATPase subunit KdpC [Clostridium tertium]
MKVISKAFKFILVFMIICGLIYPVFITGASQLLFKDKANGSIIEVNGKKYGSVLLAQEFTGDEYLWGRVMNLDTSTFTDENGEVLMYATPSNLSPASEEYEKLVSERIEKIKASNPDKKDDPIPVDLVTSSGSGLDPHISVAAAEYQVERISKARNISTDEVEQIIEKYTKGRALGVFGEETVNVLQVNLALDGKL